MMRDNKTHSVKIMTNLLGLVVETYVHINQVISGTVTIILVLACHVALIPIATP